MVKTGWRRMLIPLTVGQGTGNEKRAETWIRVYLGNWPVRVFMDPSSAREQRWRSSNY